MSDIVPYAPVGVPRTFRHRFIDIFGRSPSLVDHVIYLLVTDPGGWTESWSEGERTQSFKHTAGISLSHKHNDRSNYPFIFDPIRFRANWWDRRRLRKALQLYAVARIEMCIRSG